MLGSMEFDTAPVVAARYHALIGALSPRQRLARAEQLSRDVRTLAMSGLRHRHPDANEVEIRWRFAALCYGSVLAERTFGPFPGGSV